MTFPKMKASFFKQCLVGTFLESVRIVLFQDTVRGKRSGQSLSVPDIKTVRVSIWAVIIICHENRVPFGVTLQDITRI